MWQQKRPLRLEIWCQKPSHKDKLPQPPEMTWVLEAINGESEIPELSRASRRLRRILAGLHEVDKVRSELAQHLDEARHRGIQQHLWPKDHVFADPHLDHLNRHGEEKLLEVNALLDRYIRSPNIQVTVDYRMSQVPHWKSGSTGGDVEQFAVEMILEAVRKGALSRYRQCDECRGWFYAATHHQRFCKESCRKRYASKSDEYRVKRRIYMQKYRQDERERGAYAKAFTKRSR